MFKWVKSGKAYVLDVGGVWGGAVHLRSNGSESGKLVWSAEWTICGKVIDSADHGNSREVMMEWVEDRVGKAIRQVIDAGRGWSRTVEGEE